jgi:hypothetical protein
MMKEMNDREINYTNKRVAATLTGSKHNFFKGIQSKIESPKTEISQPDEDIFYLRL